MSILTKVLGDPNKGEVRRHERRANEINALEEEMQQLSDEQLRAKTQEFRDRLGIEGPDLSLGQPVTSTLAVQEDDEDEGDDAHLARRDAEERDKELFESLDDLLVEAFAAVREASRRALGMRHFDVQLVTVNDYLARRDAGWNAPMYHLLGMSVGVISGQDQSFVFDPDHVDETHPDERLKHLRPCSRREAYACDITYATNNELGFDYLRDNMAVTLEQCVQRRLWYAIVDEVDSILVDEARTPLIISGQADEPTDKYYTYARLTPNLVAEDDFTIDEN